MPLLNVVGNLAFSIASLILGVRLLRLFRRTGELPELIIAVTYLSGGALGHGLWWLYIWADPTGIDDLLFSTVLGFFTPEGP